MDSSRITVLLCGLGFFKEFRPSEAFLSPFLYDTKNFTEQEINNEIYPVGTYSNMFLLIIIFLLSDWLRYKPIMIVQGLSGIITWTFLIWGKSVLSMQIVQIFYGLFCACDVAYFSYLYAKIDKKHYQKATAHTKATILLSKSCSGLIAQLLIIYQVFDYLELNYLTLGSLSVATLWAAFLPAAPYSVYFNKEIKAVEAQPGFIKMNAIKVDAVPGEEGERFIKSVNVIPVECAEKFNLKSMFYLWREAMNSSHTLKWSVWSALSLCGYLQVTYYVQLLWQSVINSDRPNNKVYHGFSNTFNSLVGALCTFGVGYIKLDWSKYGEVTLAGASLLQGTIILLSVLVNSRLVVHYLEYASFKLLFQVSSTIAFSEIAKSLKSESYSLVLGINQFFALVEQSIFTVMVTKVFAIDIRSQFILYGGYFLLLGIGFSISAVLSFTRHLN